MTDKKVNHAEILHFMKETLQLQKKAEYLLVDISDLHPFPGNPSIEGPMSIEMLKKSIKGQGFVEDTICFREKNGELMIIAGHKRTIAMKQLGATKIPIKIYPFKSKKHAVLYCIASNRIAQIAETDFPKLKDALEFCDDGAHDLEMSGISDQEIKDMIDYTNYMSEGVEFIKESDRRAVNIKCESDDEMLKVKAVLKIDHQKLNVIKAKKFFDRLKQISKSKETIND